MRLESRPIPTEADGLRNTLNAQLQGEQPIHTQRNAGALRQAVTVSGQKAFIDGAQRQTALLATSVLGVQLRGKRVGVDLLPVSVS